MKTSAFEAFGPLLGIAAIGIFTVALTFNFKAHMDTKALISPLNNQVVIEKLKEEKISAGGIVLPDTTRNQAGLGRVFAVGRGLPVQGDSNHFHKPEVKIGDEVLYYINRSTPITVEGREFVTLPEPDILCILRRPLAEK